MPVRTPRKRGRPRGLPRDVAGVVHAGEVQRLPALPPEARQDAARVLRQVLDARDVQLHLREVHWAPMDKRGTPPRFWGVVKV